jgi:hypothetical protein
MDFYQRWLMRGDPSEVARVAELQEKWKAVLVDVRMPPMRPRKVIATLLPPPTGWRQHVLQKRDEDARFMKIIWQLLSVVTTVFIAIILASIVHL